MRLLILPIVYAAALLETSLADVVRVGHVTPDLFALVAVVWLLLVPAERSFLVAGAIGLAADLIAPGRVGLGLACFLLVGYGVARLRARCELEHLVGRLAVVFAAATLLAAGLAAGRWLMGETSLPLSTMATRALGVGLYTAGVSLPVWMLIGWLREPLRPRQNRLAEF
jgi:rod shape-determining protein MreD